MAFTKIAAAGIGSTGIVTLQNVVVTGSVDVPIITGAASTANVRSNSLVVSGVSTLGNTVVGSATTQLIVNGNARITGILTVGTSSLTFDGNTDTVRIGTGVTIQSGIISATDYYASAQRRVVAFTVGTTTLFHQAAAPTGWTKQTTHNDKALRVVSGTGGGSGGSTAFSTVMASRTPGGSVSGSNSGGSVNNTTLGLNEIPSHNHDGDGFETCRVRGSFGGGYQFGQPAGSTFFATYTNSRGGSGAHGHGFNNPSWSGSFTGTAMDFAVQYIDIILCSID